MIELLKNRMCYVICNCNVANIDIYFFFSSYIYLFVRPFFVSQKKNSSNAATREKKANSLIVRFFIFINLVNVYYQRLDYCYYFSVLRPLQSSKNFSHLFLNKSLLKVCNIRPRQHGLAVLASLTLTLSLLVSFYAIFFGLEFHVPGTCPKSMERKL